jgi:hypothetical protein
MPNGFFSLFCKKIIKKIRDRDVMELRKKLRKLFLRRISIICMGRINFDSIAGRQDNEFRVGKRLLKFAIGLLKMIGRGECQFLSNGNSARVIIAEDDLEVHCGVSLIEDSTEIAV